MKHVTLFFCLFAGSMLLVPVISFGQDVPPADNAMHDRQPENKRPNLLAELGLSQEQVQQIRRINQERRSVMMTAQRRMREANRDLDIAIYGESVSDREFEQRL